MIAIPQDGLSEPCRSGFVTELAVDRIGVLCPKDLVEIVARAVLGGAFVSVQDGDASVAVASEMPGGAQSERSSTLKFS